MAYSLLAPLIVRFPRLTEREPHDFGIVHAESTPRRYQRAGPELLSLAQQTATFDVTAEQVVRCVAVQLVEHAVSGTASA
jgi:hypothetical protein